MKKTLSVAMVVMVVVTGCSATWVASSAQTPEWGESESEFLFGNSVDINSIRRTALTVQRWALAHPVLADPDAQQRLLTQSRPPQRTGKMHSC